jgi:CW-type Zinc Finger
MPTNAANFYFRRSAFRYGQKKPVFCYRLLTEGMMEGKIYARSVTKQGVCNLVIDGQESLSRCFTAEELEDMQQDFFWVQCDRCEKWRVLPKPEELPEKWFCEMNEDLENNSCEHEERIQKWYEDRAYRGNAASDVAGPAG